MYASNGVLVIDSTLNVSKLGCQRKFVSFRRMLNMILSVFFKICKGNPWKNRDINFKPMERIKNKPSISDGMQVG